MPFKKARAKRSKVNKLRSIYREAVEVWRRKSVLIFFNLNRQINFKIRAMQTPKITFLLYGEKASMVARKSGVKKLFSTGAPKLHLH